MTHSIRPYDRALSRMSRRDLMKCVAAVGAYTFVDPFFRSGMLAQAPSVAYPFTLGVASGDPLPGGIVLWTRLAPKPLEGGGMPASNAEVAWELASDPEFRTVVQKSTSIARPELGHSVHVEVEGLQPGREYWYRFHFGGAVSPAGRTKTAPAAGAQVERLRFAVCGCSQYETGYFTAYRRIADEAFDFIFHTGDYIYEGRGNPKGLRQHQGDEIYSLVDYRNRYAQYKMDADLAAAHASAPFIVTWDDHEVDNDYAGHLDERNTPSELFLLRRAAAYQAYYENMPLRASTIPNGPNLQLYRRLQFGRLVDFSVLDTRQFRDKQACTGRPGCGDVRDTRRTILGPAQETWLYENLARSQGTWTVLGQQVPTFARDNVRVNPEARFSMDKWDGYPGARERLYARILEARTPNPVLLSGDVHLHYAADLKRDFADPRSATLGVELTNTSITSGGDGSAVSGTWEQTRGDNPHIKYHGARRGYIACTVTSKTLQADFKVLDRVTVPDSPARIDTTVTIEAGKPGLA